MKKSISNKFYNIAYPIFTTTSKPYKIEYSIDKIYFLKSPDSKKELIDDKNYSGDYFARLLQITDRFKFDNTCKNLQDLLMSKAKWGMDSQAIPHDFSQLVAVPAEKRRVIKIDNSLVWVRGISYPFEITTSESFSNLDELYVTIIHVNGEWFIKDFSYDKVLKRPYVYV
jgi:hypothetical protein